MKEVFLTQDQIEIVDENQIKKQKQFVGSLRPNLGHFCFEYNVETNELSFAKFEDPIFDLHTGKPIRRKVSVKEECLYITALNRKNAVRKLSKILNKEVIPN